MTVVTNLKQYILDSIAEMKKVVWPSRRQTIQYTIIVIVLSVGLALLLGALDYVFNLGLEKIIIK